MTDADCIALEFLEVQARFGASQIRHLRRWWLAVRNDGEGLISFLRRQQLLSEASLSVLMQIGEGNLSTTLGSILIEPDELSRLRTRLPDLAKLEEDAAVPATVTLLNDDDTAKDLRLAPASGPASDFPRVGQAVGKYLLTEQIGYGANGSVFRALHPTLQIPVAIKVLHPAGSDADHRRQLQLEAEARLLARLNHPYIVRVFDFERDAPYPFLVLEYVNGPTLAELIAHSGRLQAERVIHILRQLVEALAGAHRHGIVHRDIKPANILLTRDGDVKLADLGLATLADPQQAAGQPGAPTTARCGTICYAAPELFATTLAIDERSDIYSLGATLYHAAVGRPPFSGSSIWDVIEQHVKEPPTAPHQVCPDIPVELSQVLLWMLSKDPTLRPRSCADLLAQGVLVPGPEGGAAKPSLWQRILPRWMRSPVPVG